MPRKPKRDHDGCHRRKDKQGRYQITWMGIDPNTGEKKRRTKLLKTKSHKKAQLMRAEVLRQSEGGEKILLPDITLNHYADRYLEAHKDQKDRCKPQRIMNYILPALGDRPLIEISLQEYRDFAESLMGDRTGDARLRREKTVNRYMSALKHMIRWGVDEELVPDQVLARVRRSKQNHESQGRKIFFYKQHVLDLLEVCSEGKLCGGYLRPMILLGLGTGIRKGDLVKLRWRDVDENAGTIWVGGDSGTDTKGKKGYLVELGGIARFGLEEAQTWLLLNGKKDGQDDWVIDWRSRSRLLWLHSREYRAVREEAGLDPKYIFHCTRHSYATWSLAHGHDLVSVKEWMGHASIVTTQKYLHALPRNRKLRDTVDPMDENSDAAFRKDRRQVVSTGTRIHESSHELVN